MQEQPFVTYEYRSVSVRAKDQTRMLDFYESFGWELTGTVSSGIDGVTHSLRRNRKQKHRQELCKLERQAEDVLNSIGGLQAAKRRGPRIFAVCFGCLATLLLGGGMSLIMLTAQTVAAWIGGIALGVAGIVLCSVNFPIYQGLVGKKTRQLIPVIDDQEEKLAALMENGSELLRTELI